MSVPDSRSAPWRCVFCRMLTSVRTLRVPLCEICRDQVNDFIWVSLVQVLLLAVGLINGLFFVAEEVLLFIVLIVIKHKLPPVLDRFTEST